jgi:splicing factor 3B subunit 3
MSSRTKAPGRPGGQAAAARAQVANLLNEETAQLYALCGRGARASLRVLRHGLAVAEMAVSELPGNPTAVWTIRRAAADELDAYIVVSFTNATLVQAPGAWF